MKFKEVNYKMKLKHYHDKKLSWKLEIPIIFWLWVRRWSTEAAGDSCTCSEHWDFDWHCQWQSDSRYRV